MRPEVRIIQDQQIESKPIEVTGYEAEQLLRKYSPTQKFTTHQEPIETIPVNNDLTFEEMIKQEEEKLRKEKEREYQKQNSPLPITFNGDHGYESEVKYKSVGSGISMKITVSTDMKLPDY